MGDHAAAGNCAATALHLPLAAGHDPRPGDRHCPSGTGVPGEGRAADDAERGAADGEETPDNTADTSAARNDAGGDGGGRRTPGPKTTAWRVRRAAAWTIITGCIFLILAVILLPARQRAPQVPSLLYAANGSEVAALSPGENIPVTYADVPAAMRNATIAAEDATFWRNFGIDPASILRAALVDIRAGAIVQGGSTITQQLAKNLYLTDARTWSRKFLEVLYTLRLEATHSKRQILTTYLNTIYYGSGAYGIGAAAETYFAEPVGHLDLAQATLLAGLPDAPQLYDPYLHPRAARTRQRWILGRMVILGLVTRAEAHAAAEAPLYYQRGTPPPAGPPSGYFTNYVLTAIAHHDPSLETAVLAGGYRVYTTLSPTAQAAADSAFANDMPPVTMYQHGVAQPEGALVAIDPHNGAVRALIGGRSYRRTPYNRALFALRQPGSTFKPFLYATAIGDGYPVTDRLFDGPITFPGVDGKPYVPHDYDGFSYRWLTMRDALADSVNIIALKWANIVGPRQVIATAHRMGLHSPMQPTLPLVLGAYGTTPLDLADAYVPLANGGWAIAPWCVVKVVDPAGDVVWAPRPPRPRRALDPGVAYIVTNMMESVMTVGTGRKLRPIVNRPVAGKTGTSNALKDAWFAGFTPALVAVVWVGDDKPEPGVGYGDMVAGPVWAHFMAGALAHTPPSDFPRPADVEVLTVSAIDGLLPNATSPTVREVFLRRAAPKKRTTIEGYAGHDPGIIGIPGSQIAPPASAAAGGFTTAAAGAGLPLPVRLPGVVWTRSPPRDRANHSGAMRQPVGGPRRHRAT